MTDTPDLKPCPFCRGGITTIEGKGQTWRGTGGYSDPNYYELRHFGQLSDADDFPRCCVEFRTRTAADAVNFWNRRADLALTDAHVVAHPRAQALADAVNFWIVSAIRATSAPLADAGRAYPWPSLDAAEERARAALRTMETDND